MAGNRKAAQAQLLKDIEALLPGGENAPMYEAMFKRMDDAQFDAFMQKIKAKQTRPAIVAPIAQEPSLTVERNLALAKRWGHNFFERIRIPAKNGMPAYLTPQAYLVIELPLRRQAQILVDKISIPKHSNSVDNLTGQPAGASAGSRVSNPEINVLASQGLEKSLTELIKYRGGDIKGFQMLTDTITQTGDVTLHELEQVKTTVKATQTLSTYFTAMHLSNNL